MRLLEVIKKLADHDAEIVITRAPEVQAVKLTIRTYRYGRVWTSDLLLDDKRLVSGMSPDDTVIDWLEVNVHELERAIHDAAVRAGNARG